MKNVGRLEDWYIIQELKNTISHWVLYNKVRLSEIPQEIRIELRTPYIMAIRYARDSARNGKEERYVEELRLIYDDIIYAREHGLDRYEDIVQQLWDSMYYGEGYFQGGKYFDEFVYEQKATETNGFREKKLPFPNRYALGED